MIQPNEAMQAISTYYDLNYNLLTVRGENGFMFKSKEYAKARHIFYYWCREKTDLSFKKIATYTSNVDHSSIIYAVNRVRDDYFIYPLFRKQVEEIFEIIRQKELNLQTNNTLCLEEILPSV